MANFENLVELFEHSIQQFSSRNLFGTKTNGRWEWLTYGEFGKQVEQFRGGLVSLGIQRGDRIAFISNNRVEWAVAAYACYTLGVAVVPMYEAQLPKEWAFIINDCEAVAALVSTPQIYEKLKDVSEKVPTIKHVICLFEPKNGANGAGPRTTSFKELLETGAKSAAPAIKPTPKDTASLIYTSGTTGNPKGVILTHGNFASNISAVYGLLPLNSDDRSLSFLPWAHAFGHTCELLGFVALGASMALAESVDKIIPNLAEVQPTVLVSVPRIFNRIYDGLHKQISEKPAVVQALFHAGLRASLRQKRGESLGLVEKLTLAVADKVVFSKVRTRFGGRLKYAFSGGAALSHEVAEFIDALNVTVYEGYGLTETSPIATANFPGARRLGSVGKAIPEVKIVIDKSETNDPKQGEVVIYGPNVMAGYHNRDEENKAVFTADGGFRSGDLGHVDDDGFLFITGRIKEQYKLENGKYVAPAPLEEKIKLSPHILSAMIYGDNRLFNVALIVPDMPNLKDWVSAQGLSAASDEELLRHPQVLAHLQAEIDKYSADFKGFERVKKIAVIAEDFTTENGMLTATMKLKRRIVLQKYQPLLESLYAGSAADGKSAAAAAG